MIIKDIHASLLRFCADFAEKFPGTVVVFFDAHADESTLPEADVVGLTGVTVSVENHLTEVKCMIGISTLDDTNLFRLTDLTAELFESLLPTKRIPVYDASTGIEKGWMILQDGTTLLPVTGSAARPMQYALVHLSSSQTFTLA